MSRGPSGPRFHTMEITTLPVLAIAAYRLMWLAVRDEITRPLREGLTKRGGRLGYLATCPACVGVWASAGTAALYLWGGSPGRFILWTLAVAGATFLLDLGLIRWTGPVPGGNDSDVQRDRKPCGCGNRTVR